MWFLSAQLSHLTVPLQLDFQAHGFRSGRWACRSEQYRLLISIINRAVVVASFLPQQLWLQ